MQCFNDICGHFINVDARYSAIHMPWLFSIKGCAFCNYVVFMAIKNDGIIIVLFLHRILNISLRFKDELHEQAKEREHIMSD